LASARSPSQCARPGSARLCHSPRRSRRPPRGRTITSLRMGSPTSRAGRSLSGQRWDGPRARFETQGAVRGLEAHDSFGDIAIVPLVTAAKRVAVVPCAQPACALIRIGSVRSLVLPREGSGRRRCGRDGRFAAKGKRPVIDRPSLCLCKRAFLHPRESALLAATGEIPAMVRSGGLSLLTNTPNDPADPLRQASQCTDLITRRPTSHRVNFAGSSESTTPFGDPG
jgi:hypothetical protein